MWLSLIDILLSSGYTEYFDQLMFIDNRVVNILALTDIVHRDRLSQACECMCSFVAPPDLMENKDMACF